ncbi:hypothetical protein TIFTF001_019110 [Ficus carica]|uniref:Uncharacterized protein n=1 Tax=Ficus carica TaxID=3494 RepID=A0AA88ASL9_FICCA|nr:hypothetical protein TIFTF001_019110 [Ficus carica]
MPRNLRARRVRANGGDSQEEVYQKIKAMKEQYLPELNEMYQKIVTKLQQLDSLPQQPNSVRYEKVQLFKIMLERAIVFLQVPKTSILPRYKEKLAPFEKQIVSFINVNRHRRPVSQQQQGQVPSSHTEISDKKRITFKAEVQPWQPKSLLLLLLLGPVCALPPPTRAHSGGTGTTDHRPPNHVTRPTANQRRRLCWPITLVPGSRLPVFSRTFSCRPSSPPVMIFRARRGATSSPNPPCFL